MEGLCEVGRIEPGSWRGPGSSRTLLAPQWQLAIKISYVYEREI